MKRFALKGVDALQKPCRVGKDVVNFVDVDNHFTITVLSKTALKLVTMKGVHTLKKHATQNYFHNELNGHKVQVSLKAISGELRYW